MSNPTPPDLKIADHVRFVIWSPTKGTYLKNGGSSGEHWSCFITPSRSTAFRVFGSTDAHAFLRDLLTETPDARLRQCVPAAGKDYATIQDLHDHGIPYIV